MLNAQKIAQYLHTEKLGRCPELFDVLKGSTQDEARRLLSAADGGSAEVFVATDNQQSGRGRYGRTWICHAGEGLAMSIGMLRPSGSVVPENTLVTGLAVRRALVKLAPGLETGLRLKWPNDLLINGRKVCGILVQLFPADTQAAGGEESEPAPARDAAAPDALVIGIGINVGQLQFPGHEELGWYPTSLALEGVDISMEEIIAAVCNELEPMLDTLWKEGFAPFEEEYNRVLTGAKGD